MQLQRSSEGACVARFHPLAVLQRVNLAAHFPGTPRTGAPLGTQALSIRASCYMKKKQYAEAVLDYNSVVEQAPDVGGAAGAKRRLQAILAPHLPLTLPACTERPGHVHTGAGPGEVGAC